MPDGFSSAVPGAGVEAGAWTGAGVAVAFGAVDGLIVAVGAEELEATGLAVPATIEGCVVGCTVGCVVGCTVGCVVAATEAVGAVLGAGVRFGREPRADVDPEPRSPGFVPFDAVVVVRFWPTASGLAAFAGIQVVAMIAAMLRTKIARFT